MTNNETTTDTNEIARAAKIADGWTEIGRSLDRALDYFTHAMPEASHRVDDTDWINVCEAAANAKANAVYWNSIAAGDDKPTANALMRQHMQNGPWT